MATTREIINEWRDRLGSVPRVSSDFVCDYCLGAVTNYSYCWGCNELFNSGGVPMGLSSAVVPMTSVLMPSPWYSALVGYKGFQKSYGSVLASITYHFLTTNAEKISEMLGGAPTILTIVPSKRGISYTDQPLRAALSRVISLKDQLRQTLGYDANSTVPRRGYCPDAFRPGPCSVEGERVALIEDTWVTGATAISAAGALLEYGAASLGVFPIARVIKEGFWPDDHPYRLAMNIRVDLEDEARWPR